MYLRPTIKRVVWGFNIKILLKPRENLRVEITYILSKNRAKMEVLIPKFIFFPSFVTTYSYLPFIHQFARIKKEDEELKEVEIKKPLKRFKAFKISFHFHSNFSYRVMSYEFFLCSCN